MEGHRFQGERRGSCGDSHESGSGIFGHGRERRGDFFFRFAFCIQRFAFLLEGPNEHFDGDPVFAADDLEEDRFEGDAGAGAFSEGAFCVDEEVEDVEALLLRVEAS